MKCQNEALMTPSTCAELSHGVARHRNCIKLSTVRPLRSLIQLEQSGTGVQQPTNYHMTNVNYALVKVYSYFLDRYFVCIHI